MDEEYESGEPVVRRVDEVTSEEAAAPERADTPATPLGPDAGSGGWMWVPPPLPPGAPGTGDGPLWVGPPGPYWAVPPPPQPPRRHATTVLFVVVLLLIGIAAGFGIGHVVWQSNSAVGFTSFGELAVVRLAEFPVRIGHLAIWIGHLAFWIGRLLVRIGLVGIQSVGIWSPCGQRGDCLAGRPWPCGC